MAEWKIRGFVPDSDEEEDSQGIERRETPETTSVGLPQNNDATAGEVAIDRATVEVGDSAAPAVDLPTQAKAVEVRISQGAKPTSECSSKTIVEGGLSQTYGFILPEDDIDELQEGHYNHAHHMQLPGPSKDSESITSGAEIPGVAHRLSASRDGKPMRDVRRTSSHSSLSSELSSLPDMIDAPELKSPSERQPVLGSPATENSHHPPVRVTDAVMRDLGTSKRSGRSLRHRNPIQLHPYAIEGQQYKKNMNARGMKALRTAYMESQASTEHETQNQDYQASQSSRSPSPRDALSFAPLNADRHIDDEFPDMDILLCRQSDQFVAQGHKRRKVKKVFRLPPAIHPRPGSRQAESIRVGPWNDENIFDVPPSPPLSGSQTPVASNVRSQFHMPPALSSKALPTPATSSEPRRPPLLDVLERDSSQSDDMEVSHRNSRSPFQISEHESADSIHHAKRRIRGVLPASWLRLDLKTQAKKPDRHQQRTSLSPEKQSIIKGVARPVMRTMTNSPSRRTSPPAIFELSDDGSVSPEGNVHSRSSLEHEVVPLHDDDDDNLSCWGEAMENDEVDQMLPPIQRAARHSRTIKKRQMRMADFGIERRLTSSRKSSARQLPNRYPRTISSSLSGLKTPKPRARPPKLSILDAPSMAGSPPFHRTPAFLRIASRTARSRVDQGRHSPSYKYLRLASKKDTDDVTQSLQDWKSGSIAPNAGYAAFAPNLRQPLRPRSANSSLPVAPRAHGTKSSLHQTVKVRRSQLYRREARKMQSSLDTLIDRHKRRKSVKAYTSRPTNPSSHKTLNPAARLTSSVKTLDNARPANLEISQDERNISSLRAALGGGTSRTIQGRNPSALPQPLWDKFLETPISTHPIKSTRDLFTADETDAVIHQGARSLPEPRKRGKRRPRRLEGVEHWFEEVDDAMENGNEGFMLSPKHVDPESLSKTGPVLLGLGPFGSSYTSTFDVVPFQPGTCFHESTFLGSGDFDRSLRLISHDLDCPRGSAVFSHEERWYQWGAWTEIISAELDDLVHQVETSAQELATYTPVNRIVVFQRHLISYFSDHLSFLDPIDRLPFVHKGIELMKILMCDMTGENLAHNEGQGLLHRQTTPEMVANRMYKLVIVNQLCQVGNHPVVPKEVRHELSELLDACSTILRDVIQADLKNLLLLTLTGRTSSNAPVIRDNVTVEAFVVARCVLARNEHAWKIFFEGLLHPPRDSPPCPEIHVDILENQWKINFALQPLLEFDSQGVLEAGRRFKVLTENWACVRLLVNPVLEIYISNAAGQAPCFNSYCRAIFARCLYLMKAWGWRRCDTIIGVLFDFFARNSLNHLRNEESRGSPAFLEDLGKSLDLQAEPEDRCFHLLLKIVGTGIRFLRQISPERKIRDLVWRLMPNHGRSHPKDETLQQQDLDALRNHHDLLCTLYWASPPGFRPRLSVLRNLVHIENSHKEVCHINIRAWSNLVRYQLSTDEPLTDLEPFVEWHQDLVQQILRQHSLARTEAEEQVRSIQNAQGLLVSQHLLESIIAKNQRQVEAVLSDALTFLNRAMNSARIKAAATLLLSRSVTTAFVIYDSTRSETISPVLESLSIVLSYIRKCHALDGVRTAQDDNDDSQDYGDWPTGGEDSIENAVQSSEIVALEEVQRPLHQLLSNCFGADKPPSDNLLSQLVRVWTAVGQELVKHGRRSWTDYIGCYGNDTWSSLRGTDQTRKYTAWYLTMLLETDSAIFNQNRGFFLRFWIGSLMERESLLKFQHDLTSALLNTNSEDPLLENLPFWKARPAMTYSITARDFSERRVSLISCVLSNMRASIDDYQQRFSTETASLKQEYKDLLRSMMSTMKHNYQELGHGSNVKGAYVDFVHKVVEYLQQYTSSICPIDRFFTDNTSFPLPATDPTYVVGRLKNYGLRLQDPRAGKELAVFLQSVSERAAIDGQQACLVDQLHAAMANTFESGNQRPTLRAFIIRTIIPAYMQMAFTTACGWILVSPFLEAASRVFDELRLDLDGCNIASVQSVGSIIGIFLGTIEAAVTPILDQPPLLQRAPTISTLRSSYACITALLPTLDYLLRLGASFPSAIGSVNFFTSLSFYITQDFADPIAMSDFAVQNLNTDLPNDVLPAIRRFATDGLSQTLERNWASVDGHYFATVGALRREVTVDVGSLEEEMQGLKSEVHDFWTCLETMPGLGGGVDWLNATMGRIQAEMEDFVI